MEAAIHPRRPEMTSLALSPYAMLQATRVRSGSAFLRTAARDRIATGAAVLVATALAVLMAAVILAGMAAAPTSDQGVHPGRSAQPSASAQPAPSQDAGPAAPGAMPQRPDAPLR
jgi:hypothetical protein